MGILPDDVTPDPILGELLDLIAECFGLSTGIILKDHGPTMVEYEIDTPFGVAVSGQWYASPGQRSALVITGSGIPLLGLN